MARHQAPLVLILVLLFAGTATGLAFNVNVAPGADQSVYDVSYANTTASVQTVSLVVENSGSIGCIYRLDAVLSQGNDTVVRSAAPVPLFPGATADISLPFIAYNTTGPVDVTLELTYCGRTANLTTFTYTMTERVLNASTLQSRTVSVSPTAATVSLDIDEGLLVPRESPALWHAAPAEVVNGSATVRYGPPLFAAGRELTYTVVDPSGAVVGETTVTLTAEPTLLERLVDAKWRVLLALSLGFNAVLLLLLARDRIRARASRATRAWKHFKQSRRN